MSNVCLGTCSRNARHHVQSSWINGLWATRSGLSFSALRKQIAPRGITDRPFYCASRSQRQRQQQQQQQQQQQACHITSLRSSFHTHLALRATRKPPPRPQKLNRSPCKPASQASITSLDQTELQTVFGIQINQRVGNQILRILQARRVTGSLVGRGLSIDKADVPKDALKQALQWLRERYPVDEKTAAGKWADKAVSDVERDFDRRTEESLNDANAANQDVYSRPGNRSMLDDMRIHNEEQARKREQEMDRSGQTQRTQELRLAKTAEAEKQAKQRAVALAERRKKQTEDAYVFKGDLPNLTLNQRLLVPTLMVLWIMGVMVYVSLYYEPPKPGHRLMDDLPPTIATLVGLSGFMTIITCLWHVPKFWLYMNMFMLSVPALPHPVSMIGNIFSHQNFKHLTANLAFLWLYGISLNEDIGRGNFMAIFTAGGSAGSLVSLYYHVLTAQWQATMSGASGGVAALIVAWAYLNATDHEGPLNASSPFLQLAKFCGYAFLLFQIPLHFLPGIGKRIDIMAHAGGAMVGLISAILLRARMDKQRQLNRSEQHNIIKATSLNAAS